LRQTEVHRGSRVTCIFVRRSSSEVRKARRFQKTPPNATVVGDTVDMQIRCCFDNRNARHFVDTRDRHCHDALELCIIDASRMLATWIAAGCRYEGKKLSGGCQPSAGGGGRLQRARKWLHCVNSCLFEDERFSGVAGHLLSHPPGGQAWTLIPAVFILVGAVKFFQSFLLYDRQRKELRPVVGFDGRMAG